MSLSFYLGGTNADLTVGADFYKYLEDKTEAAGTISVSVAAATTDTSYGYTRANALDGATWETGGITVKVKVTTSSSNVNLKVSASRLNSTGTVQDTTDETAEQLLDSASVFTFNIPSKNWGTTSDTDRLRINYIFRNDHTKAARTIEIETGTTDTEVATPFTEDVRENVLVEPPTATTTASGQAPTITTNEWVAIERRIGEGGEWELIAKVPDPDVESPADYLDIYSFIDSTEYFYRARRYEDGNYSDWSNIDSVVVTSDIPTSGLVLHLDADAITGLSDNDPVETWNDLSGNNYHATQATLAVRPTYRTNILDGKPIVRFDGIDNYLGLPSGAMGLLRAVEGTTIITLVRFANLTSDRKQIFFANTEAGEAVTRFSSTYNQSNFEVSGRRLDNDTFKQLFGNVTPAIDTWYIKACIVNHNNDTAAIYLDGNSIGSSDFQGVGVTSDTDSVNINISRAPGYPITTVDGDIAEILVYNRALSTEEREQVEQYLGEKWLGWSLVQNVTITAPSGLIEAAGNAPSLTVLSPLYYEDLDVSAGNTYHYRAKKVENEVEATEWSAIETVNYPAVGAVLVEAPQAMAAADAGSVVVTAAISARIETISATATSEASPLTLLTTVNATTIPPPSLSEAAATVPSVAATKNVSVLVSAGLSVADSVVPVISSTKTVSVDSPVAEVATDAVIPEISTIQSVNISSPVALTSANAIVSDISTTKFIVVDVPLADSEAKGTSPSVSTTGSISLSVVSAEVNAEGIVSLTSTTKFVSVVSVIGEVDTQAIVPDVSAIKNVSINVDTGLIESQAIAASITTVQAVMVNSPIAIAMSVAITPSISAIQNISIENPTAETDSEAVPPVVQATKTVEINASIATSIAEATVPTIVSSINTIVSTISATSTSDATTPIITALITINATVIPPPTEADTEGIVPSIATIRNININSPIAVANSQSDIPTVTATKLVSVLSPISQSSIEAVIPNISSIVNTSILIPIGITNAEAFALDVSATHQVSIISATAQSSSDAGNVQLYVEEAVHVTIASPTALCSIEAVIPNISSTKNVSITTPSAINNAQADVPSVLTESKVSITSSQALSEADAVVPQINTTKLVSIETISGNSNSTATEPQITTVKLVSLNIPQGIVTTQAIIPIITTEQNPTVTTLPATEVEMASAIIHWSVTLPEGGGE